jgi:hypothetical protein
LCTTLQFTGQSTSIGNCFMGRWMCKCGGEGWRAQAMKCSALYYLILWSPEYDIDLVL